MLLSKARYIVCKESSCYCTPLIPPCTEHFRCVCSPGANKLSYYFTCFYLFYVEILEIGPIVGITQKNFSSENKPLLLFEFIFIFYPSLRGSWELSLDSLSLSVIHGAFLLLGPSFSFFSIFLKLRKGGERERLFHLFMPSLVDPCMCHDWGIEPTTSAHWDDTLTT